MNNIISGQEDLDRLEMVETVEELKDVYQHFLLFHGRPIGPCQEFHRKKVGSSTQSYQCCRAGGLF